MILKFRPFGCTKDHLICLSVKEAVGEDTCLACAIGTSSNSKINVAFCNQKHMPRHEHNGSLHVMPQGWAEKFNDKLTGKTFRADFVVTS